MTNEYQNRNTEGGREFHEVDVDMPPPSYGTFRADGETGQSGRRYNGENRGWWDRASDEVSSWFENDHDEQPGGSYDMRTSDRGESYGTQYIDYGRNYRRENLREGRRSWESMQASDVMTRDVVRVHPHDSVQYAAKLMDGYDCGALPVVDWNNRLIGMITDRDIAVRAVANRRNAEQVPVGNIMTEDAHACHFDDSLRQCMRTMSRHQIRRIPIVDDNNRVVGIVSQADIAQCAAENETRGARRAFTEVVSSISERTDDANR